MATIEKKVWPEFFAKLESGDKTFELRLADFDVAEGDTLILKEWDPVKKEYTGKQVEKKVGYIYSIKSLKDLEFWPEGEIEKYGINVISLK
jgi:hypothetical protein